ncbi:MAG: NADH-quinone oxidoreductase subunit L [Acidimicrobiia bacterium]
MLDLAWIIVALPALSFLLILFFGKRMPRGGSEIGVASIGACFIMACIAGAQWIDRVGGSGEGVRQPIRHGFTWWQFGGAKFGVGIQIDGLACMMLFVVTLISLLVHVYSLEYMRDDRRYTYYYAALSLFTCSMLILVVADNTLQLMTGWELVGLCSFMLIGHWWEEQDNSNAALKAFFTTRTGDIGLMIGVIICFFAAGGTFDLMKINGMALEARGGHAIWLVAGACLLLGIMGKSGQFPLHTWLPDAMAGPTPVSALIHAATMVVAGVYLSARLYGVFWQGFSIRAGGVNIMAIIGGITIIAGAALAFVQTDIKKVLAYSTISQLGYMVMGMGVGAWLGAVFHLFTHAFFKANLFLGAGSVAHSGSHHSFDMKKDMGGLREHMPHTFKTFMIGTVALAGLPPLAAFWSKDEILATAGQGGFTIFVVVGLIGAVMTAAYMTRCVYLTFFGEYRGHHHPHESPKSITGPLWVLSVLSVTAGLLNATPLGIHAFKDWVEPEGVTVAIAEHIPGEAASVKTVAAFPEPKEHGLVEPDFDYALAGISVLVALSGITAAYMFYWKKKGLIGLTERNKVAKAGHTLLVNKYYLDVLYTDKIVGGIKKPVANAAYWINQHVIDGVVNGAGTVSKAAANFAYDQIDRKVVDGSINATAAGTSAAGGGLRVLQSGKLQRYALFLMGSVAVIAAIAAWMSKGMS